MYALNGKTNKIASYNDPAIANIDFSAPTSDYPRDFHLRWVQDNALPERFARINEEGQLYVYFTPTLPISTSGKIKLTLPTSFNLAAAFPRCSVGQGDMVFNNHPYEWDGTYDFTKAECSYGNNVITVKLSNLPPLEVDGIDANIPVILIFDSADQAGTLKGVKMPTIAGYYELGLSTLSSNDSIIEDTKLEIYVRGSAVPSLAVNFEYLYAGLEGIMTVSFTTDKIIPVGRTTIINGVQQN